jgi:hypothetical protein
MRPVVTDYVVKPLNASTWDAFARLVERHNGVFGGCWCTWFHTFHADKTFTAEGNRALKERLVEEGRAHAALVFDGNEAVAWAQYGPPEAFAVPSTYRRGRRRVGRGLPARHRRQEGVRPLQRHALLYEQAGFAYVRPKGKRNCVMRRVVP